MNADLSKIMINTICNTTFLFMRYLILSLNNPKSNNIKCLALPSGDIINPSIFSNLIRNGFGPVTVLYKMF